MREREKKPAGKISSQEAFKSTNHLFPKAQKGRFEFESLARATSSGVSSSSKKERGVGRQGKEKRVALVGAAARRWGKGP